MPELLQSFLGSILRHVLSGAGVYFVTHGYFTQGDLTNYIVGFTAVSLSMGWSFYQKYAAQAELTLEQEVTHYIKTNMTASTSTPSNPPATK